MHYRIASRIRAPPVLHAHKPAALVESLIRSHAPLGALPVTRVHVELHKEVIVNPSPVRITIPMPTSPNAVSDVQQFYNSVFVTRPHDQYAVNALAEIGDFDQEIPNCAVKPSKINKNVRLDPLHDVTQLPLLQTGEFHARDQTLTQNILGVGKRNCNVTTDCPPKNTRTHSTRAIDHFYKTWCIPGAREILAIYRKETVNLEIDNFVDYFNDLENHKTAILEDPRQGRIFLPDNSVDVEELRSYSLMVKTEVKNNLDPSKFSEYPATQVLAAHSSKVNALYGPLFRVLFARLQTILKPEIYVHLRKNLASLEKHLNTFIDPDYAYHHLEVDHSQYDKSQQDGALAVELQLYSDLGLDDILMQMWGFGHTQAVLRNFVNGIKLMVFFQRKSGDVATAFGNTILNMIALASSADLSSTAAAYFVGDDSFIFTRELIDSYDLTNQLRLGWNFQSKIIVGKGVYFCSAFLVHAHDSFAVMPDPMKRIEKLSKRIKSGDVQDHLARWESYKDLCRNYSNRLAVDALEPHFTRRYGDSGLFLMGMTALSTLLEDYGQFCTLWQPVGRTDPSKAHKTEVLKVIGPGYTDIYVVGKAIPGSYMLNESIKLHQLVGPMPKWIPRPNTSILWNPNLKDHWAYQVKQGTQLEGPASLHKLRRKAELNFGCYTVNSAYISV